MPPYGGGDVIAFGRVGWVLIHSIGFFYARVGCLLL